MIIDISTARAQQGGLVLKAARESLGMTKTATAAAIGVAMNTYRLWELGTHTPLPELAPRVSQVLNIPLEQVPARGKRKPAKSRPVDMSSEKKAELVRKYAPYRARRLELGLQQEDLAKRAGVATNTISAMESGSRNVHWATLQKIRKALGWPEARHFTVEERNAELLRMDNIIHWVLNRHREYLLEAGADLEDVYQDLALCAIKALDRYDPSGGATVENYLITQLKSEVKNIRRRAIAKGLVGKGTNRLAFNTTVSFDEMTQYGYEIALGAAA